MHRVSILQAIDVWSDLLEAYHRVNSHDEYEGNEVQIYLYRLMPSCPGESFTRNTKWGVEAKLKLAVNANSALHGLIEILLERYEAEVFLDDKPFGPWLKESLNDWRWQIRVVSKKPKENIT